MFPSLSSFFTGHSLMRRPRRGSEGGRRATSCLHRRAPAVGGAPRGRQSAGPRSLCRRSSSFREGLGPQCLTGISLTIPILRLCLIRRRRPRKSSLSANRPVERKFPHLAQAIDKYHGEIGGVVEIVTDSVALSEGSRGSRVQNSFSRLMPHRPDQFSTTTALR